MKLSYSNPKKFDMGIAVGNAIGVPFQGGSQSWKPVNQETIDYIGDLTISLERQQLIDSVVTGLKTATGEASLADAFCFLYLLGNEGNEIWKKNLVKDNHHIVQHGGTQTEDDGWQGNGIDAYLDTDFNPSTDGGAVYTLNNASLAIHSLTDVAETKCDIGARTTTSDYASILSRTATDTSASRLHGSSHPVVNGAVTSSIGLFSVMRNGADAASLYGYKNLEAIISSVTGITTNIPNSKFFIGARSLSGVPELFSTRKYSIAWAGRYFTFAELTAIYNVLVGTWF